MVAHTFLDVLYAHLAVGLNPKGHVFGIGILAKCPGKIAVETVIEVAEERPDACIAIATAAKVGCCIGPFPREVLVGTLVPTHQAGIAHDVFRVVERGSVVGLHTTLLHFGIKAFGIDLLTREETTDTALVGVSANGIVGHTLGHPNNTIELLACVQSLVAARSHHLENPRFVGIADGKGLAFGVVAIGFGQIGHDVDGFTS